MIKFRELATSSFNKQQESLVTNVIVTNTVTTTTATFTKKTAEDRNRSIESTFFFAYLFKNLIIINFNISIARNI